MTALKSIIAGLIGLAYACVYGFWTMLATGGGHGNFIWLLMFMFVDFFGLYFPLMAILSTRLTSFIVKIVFGSLIGFNIVASSIMIVGWITDTETHGRRLTDFESMVQVNGIEWIVFSVILHFLPTIIFAFLLARALHDKASLTDEGDSISLNLS